MSEKDGRRCLGQTVGVAARPQGVCCWLRLFKFQAAEAIELVPWQSEYHNKQLLH